MEQIEIKYRISKDIFDSAIKSLESAMHYMDVAVRLNAKPKNIVLDTWIDYQPLINGKTLVWYYCDILDEIKTKVI